MGVQLPIKDSACRETAVDWDRSACHPGGVVGYQKSRCFCYVFGSPYPSERVIRQYCFQPHFNLLSQDSRSGVTA